MASSSTAALGLHWQGPCPTWHTGPAQQHIQPRVQSPETCPAVQHPPKHPSRSHPLSLSNWQLWPCSWILFRAHSQPQFSHLPVCQLFPSRSSLTSCAMPKITSLLPVPGASSSTLICPERLQPVPGTLPTGWFPKQAYPSLPNVNLLIQLLAPLHFFIHLSFSHAPLPPLLHVSKPLPSPKIIFSTPHQRSSFLFHLSALVNICHLPTAMYCRIVHLFHPAGSWIIFSSPCCTVTSIPQNVNNLPIFPKQTSASEQIHEAAAQLTGEDGL